MLVESSVLHGDDRLREVLAKVLRAHRPAVLLRPKLAYPASVRVVDDGVLDEVRVLALELILVNIEHVGVEARDDGKRDGDENQGEVEEKP